MSPNTKSKYTHILSFVVQFLLHFIFPNFTLKKSLKADIWQCLKLTLSLEKKVIVCFLFRYDGYT